MWERFPHWLENLKHSRSALELEIALMLNMEPKVFIYPFTISCLLMQGPIDLWQVNGALLHRKERNWSLVGRSVKYLFWAETFMQLPDL